MTLLQALRHFLVEALLNMRRSWKVSLLAILVTAVSLFLGGALFLLGSNLAGALDSWQSQARLVVYMETGASVESVAEVARSIRSFDGIVQWNLVSPQDAAVVLRRRLPELGELLQGLEEEPLPASFEIELERRRLGDAAEEDWVEQIVGLPEVAGIDDDRQWIAQISFAATLLRFGAVVIGALLMAGSVFIIASVIRLAAMLHREEVRVLRLVGATEFFVRGPFVVEGLLQGLLGSVVALSGLSGIFFLLGRRQLPQLLDTLLLSSFLAPAELALIVALGTGAGLVGGLLSVRRTAVGLW